MRVASRTAPPPSLNKNNNNHVQRAPPKLPVFGVNHISFAVRNVHSARDFLVSVLGFQVLPRPKAFEDAFEGAWLCGNGIELHLVQADGNSNAAAREVPILDPKNDHISFLSPNLQKVIAVLNDDNIPFVRQTFPENNLDQLFFLVPGTHVMVEISTTAKCGS